MKIPLIDLPFKDENMSNMDYIKLFIVEHPYADKELTRMVKDLEEIDDAVEIQHIRWKQGGYHGGVCYHRLQVIIEPFDYDLFNDLEDIIWEHSLVITEKAKEINKDKTISFY